MLHQYYTYIVPKQISKCISFYSKAHINVARTFYNDSHMINFLIQNLYKRERIVTEKTNADKEKPPMPKSRTELLFHSTEVPNSYDFITFNFKEWWAHKKKEYNEYYQSKIYEKYLELGPDIATAYFVLKCGGKIKFKGHDNWMKLLKKKDISKILPTTYDSQFVLEAIDLNGCSLEFGSLNNLSNLYQLKWLSLRDCPTINDWSIDKLASVCPSLEYLNLTECINVTERGLEALYKMPNLKELIVTNFYNSVAFELTCLLLEDVNPFLTCQILQPEKKLLPEE